MFAKLRAEKGSTGDSHGINKENKNKENIRQQKGMS